jgi:hypothetical protein
VDDRNRDAAADLLHTADVASGHDIGLGLSDGSRLAGTQLGGEVGLEHVVGSGTSTADMPFRNLDDFKPSLGEQRARRLLYPLTVLQ